jgi:hypothetical protein
LEEREIRGVFKNLTDWNSFVRLTQIRFGHLAKDPSYPENLLGNPTPPSCKDPKPTPTQKTTPITIPTVTEPQTSHQPCLSTAPSPNTNNTINPHKASPPQIKPSPLKIPPKKQTKPTNHDASPHSRFFKLYCSSPSLDVPLFSGARGKNRRACDWFGRKKRARYKPSNFVDRNEFLTVSDLGVKVSGRGEGDKGSGKGGPKRLRKVLRSNTRGSTKLVIWRLAARKLREQIETQIGPWPRVSSLVRRQETGA